MNEYSYIETINAQMQLSSYMNVSETPTAFSMRFLKYVWRHVEDRRGGFQI